jgi:hypothetical protein
MTSARWATRTNAHLRPRSLAGLTLDDRRRLGEATVELDGEDAGGVDRGGNAERAKSTGSVWPVLTVSAVARASRCSAWGMCIPLRSKIPTADTVLRARRPPQRAPLKDVRHPNSPSAESPLSISSDASQRRHDR